MAKNRKQQAAIAISMKKRGVKPKKKKVRKAKKYVTAGFQQVEYGPNVLQTGALNQNQQAYLNAQMSNYQTGQDIINMDADMTLDMIQQQQEASKQKGVDATNQLLQGTKQDNFLQRLRDKFRRDKQEVTTNQGTTTYAPNQLVSPTALANTGTGTGSTVTEQAFPEIVEKTASIGVETPEIVKFGDTEIPSGYDISQGINVLPNTEGVVNLPPGGPQAPSTPGPVTPGPVPSGGGAEIALDPSKSPMNQALDFSSEASKSATTTTTEAVTKTKAPLLGKTGKLSQALTKSALGTAKGGGQTAFAKFGSKASTYALPAVIIGEGTKMLSDDKDPTTMNVGETVGTALSSAGQGAGIGSMIAGPVGAGIGAIIGTGVGLVKGIRNRNEARDKEAEREEELRDLQKEYRKDRKAYLATASPGMQRGTYYMGEMGGMNPNMSFKQKLRAQMAMGGIKPMNNQGDMIVYGPTHEQGGVMRDATTELEGGGMKDGVALPGEVITNVMDEGGVNREYYFSDHLKNPNTGNTFAQDYIKTGGMNQNAKQTFAKLQELVAGRNDKDRSPSNIAKKGGFGERLDDISGQLAKASKMHAGQSKKIGAMAEKLKVKKFFPGGFQPVPFNPGPFVNIGPQGGGMVLNRIPSTTTFNPLSPSTGGGMKVSSRPMLPSGPVGSNVPATIPKAGPPAAIPKPPSVPKVGLGKRLLGYAGRFLNHPAVATAYFALNPVDAGGMGEGSGTDLVGAGHVGGQQRFNYYTDPLTGVTRQQVQDFSGDVTGVRGKWYYPEDYGIDPNAEIKEKYGIEDDDPETTTTPDPEVNTNNLENAKPKYTVDEDVRSQQQEINQFFSQEDPDIPGKTYGDQYGFDALDEDGKLGPKTKKAIELFNMAKEREAGFDEVRAFNQSIFDDEAARKKDEVVDEDKDKTKKPPVDPPEDPGILDRLFGNKANLRTGLTALSYGANLLTAKKNLDELEELKVTPEKITPERLGKIKITNEAERKLVQESTNAALNQATSPDERIALLSKQQEAIGKSEEGRRNKQLVADLEVDKINNKNAFTAEIYNVANDFKAQIENMQIDAAVKKGRIAVMDKLSSAIATMAMDANKMETAYKNMKEYGEAMAKGVGNLSDKYMEVLMNLGYSEKEAKEIQNEVNKQQ